MAAWGDGHQPWGHAWPAQIPALHPILRNALGFWQQKEMPVGGSSVRDPSWKLLGCGAVVSSRSWCCFLGGNKRCPGI